MTDQLISKETLSRLHRHRLTLRALVGATRHRARAVGDDELVALTQELENVHGEHSALIDGVLEALDPGG